MLFLIAEEGHVWDTSLLTKICWSLDAARAAIYSGQPDVIEVHNPKKTSLDFDPKIPYKVSGEQSLA